MSKIAFLFPGQGAQSVGMGQRLHDELPQAKELFAQANEILGYDLTQLCFDGPAETLNATEHSQPALFVTSMAAVEYLKEHNPDAVANCQAAAGLSLGEYSAMVFADAISFADGLRLVRERGLAMQEAADLESSGMVSILGMEAEQVAEVCDAARQPNEVLQVANLLCPGNIAISGHRASCEKAVSIAEEMGAMRAIPLAVAGAFHTSIMQPAVERLQQALANTDIHPPRIPVISNVDATHHHSPDDLRSALVQQVCSPVLWEQCQRQLLADGSDQFYEVGNGRVLRGLMKRIDRKIKCEGVLD